MNLADHIKQKPEYKTWQNKAIETFLNLQPVNKTQFTDTMRNINEIVDSLDIAGQVIRHNDAPSIHTYIQNSGCTIFLNEIYYGKSKSILQSFKRDRLNELGQSIWDYRNNWHQLKAAVEAHKEKFKACIVTKVPKPKEPSTLAEYIPIYNIPKHVVPQLETIDQQLYDRFYLLHIQWDKDMLERYMDQPMEARTYHRMHSNFKDLLELKTGILKPVDNLQSVLVNRAKHYGRATTDFVFGRMFRRIQHIKFANTNPQFVYDINNAHVNEFEIIINNMPDGVLTIRFNMIYNRSVYNFHFNQFPAKLYLTKDGKTTQIKNT